MDCRAVQKLLHEHNADERRLNELELAHLRECCHCQAVATDLKQLKNLLQTLPSPELPNRFDELLRIRLVESSKVKSLSTRRDLRTNWLALAAAAVILCCLCGVLLWRYLPVNEQKQTTYLRLHLSVNCLKAHDKAVFEITLPEEVRLVEETGPILSRQSLIKWQSQLRPGKNEIDLPLTAKQEGQIAQATLTVEGKTYHSSVVLSAQALSQLPQVELAWNIDEQKKKEALQ